ncbi:peptidoglycan-binding protein [Streptomyces sp. NPDC006691]|uniref:peptidoglycan-binding protein n=1 Tax=Streptomyces sp. NPDC006691 TaxID=3364757 RepID=UPI00367A3504
MDASTPGPVFEDYEPTGACGCPGCADRRRTRLLPVRDGGHPAASGGARRALVAATAASVVFGGGAVAAAAPAPAPGGPGANRAADPGPPTEQGAQSGLHGAPGHPSGNGPAPLRSITRAEIINRAKTWVSAAVPYNMEAYWTDGYRQDCSGYVSMAWDLGTNEWTGSLAKFAVRMTRDELQPGDILLFHNPANPNKGSHVVIFGGWTDYTHNYYTAYEQTPPGTRKQATPYAYWKNSANYVPYRYKGLAAGTSGGEPGTATGASTGTGADSESVPTAFPGIAQFGPGANNVHVTQLGQMLVKRGGARFYTEGPGPRWGSADLNATRAFQQAQGWTGADADGIPGELTWALLVQGRGKDIPPATAGPGPGPGPRPVPLPLPVSAPGPAPRPVPVPAPSAGPAYPGPSWFRPGQDSWYVTQLGRRLVAKGFGRYYTSGPGSRWGEADRRNVEAFQRAQGWSGAEADGYPGPETWRRLFA